MGGSFTYTGKGRVIILRAKLKGSELAPDLGLTVMAMDGSRAWLSTRELWLEPGAPVAAMLNLRITPVLGKPKDFLRKEVIFVDNINQKHSLGTVEFPYLGR